jgi:6-phosphogluconolactonase (cycloisomerase 2 family)
MKGSSLILRFLSSFAIFMVAVLPGDLWAQGNFIYTNDDPSFVANTVSGFLVDTNGALTPIEGSPFLTGGIGGGGGFYASNRVIVSAAVNLLFASNTVTGDVSVFSINPSNGVLTPIGSPFSSGGGFGVIALAATPDGKFLMAVNTSTNNITVFSVGPDGGLAPITGTLVTSQFATKDTPDATKVTANGKFLAVAEPFINAVEMFSIGSNGALTSLGNFPATSTAGLLAGVDSNCASTMLYGGEDNSSATIVDEYSIGSDGTLSAMSGSPFAPTSGKNSDVVLLSPDDKTLFVSNPYSGTMTVATVAEDGSLSLLSGSPFPMKSASAPSGMATSADGRFLYVANFHNTVSVFSVAADGDLTEVVGSPFFTGVGSLGGLESLTAFPPKACVLPAPPVPALPAVQMMIKPPATPPIPVNVSEDGKLPVAILSTTTFNAVMQVDTRSLTFGHTGDESSLAFCNTGGTDVNGDGLADLICHFQAQQAGFVAGDTMAYLKGKLVSGGNFQASEAISDSTQRRARSRR